MAREPVYPQDAPVGSTPASDEVPPAATAPKADAAAPAGEGKAGESRRTKHLVAGAAIGIGSAAIVAALLYANRGRSKGKDKA